MNLEIPAESLNFFLNDLNPATTQIFYSSSVGIGIFHAYNMYASIFISPNPPKELLKTCLIAGNVVTQTAQLSDVQRRALALYEADNKRRSKDAFDFDD